MKYLPKFMNGMFKSTQLQIVEDGEAGLLDETDWEEDEEKDDDEKRHDDNHKYHRCCSKPDIGVVGKIFEFCDESKKKLYKFEEAIREYYENYPYIIIKYEKINPHSMFGWNDHPIKCLCFCKSLSKNVSQRRGDGVSR